MRKVTTLLLLLLFGFTLLAQQPASNWVDSSKTMENPEARNWKDITLISAPTTKTVDKHHVEFDISHRFGSMGGLSGGGPHTLYGFDVASDIYFSFDYGILKNLQVGIGRSIQKELIDIDIKYRPLTQKPGGSPISLAIYEDLGVIPQANSTFYAATDDSNHSIADRLVYLTQVIISRRFDRHVSVELLPTLSFRNHVLYTFNSNNDTYDENFIPAIGAGARYMFNGKIGIIADYYYIISTYRMNNNVQSYYNAFSIALEMHTGGHVFHITLSNASSLIPNNIIPYTTDAWRNGGFKLGFSISRLF
jgi:hypothetical protein